MFDIEGAACQSGYEFDLGAVEQVIILAREARVGLLLNLEDDVASLYTRRLITLASELDLGTASNTAINVNVQNLAVDDRLLAAAALAAVLLLDNLALAVAVGADCLETLNHGSHLAHHGLHTVTVTA